MRTKDCPGRRRGRIARGIGTILRINFQGVFSSHSRYPIIRPDSSHGFAQGGFLGLRVLHPLFLPGSHDAALRCLPQHLAARKLYLSCNILPEKKCVALSGVKYWDRKQRYARLPEITPERRLEALWRNIVVYLERVSREELLRTRASAVLAGSISPAPRRSTSVTFFVARFLLETRVQKLNRSCVSRASTRDLAYDVRTGNRL